MIKKAKIWKKTQQGNGEPERNVEEGRESMQRKKNVRKERPIRYVVEHVYSCTESMEGLLTVVSEEDVRKNVEEKLKNDNMRTEKKAV